MKPRKAISSKMGAADDDGQPEGPARIRQNCKPAATSGTLCSCSSDKIKSIKHQKAMVTYSIARIGRRRRNFQSQILLQLRSALQLCDNDNQWGAYEQGRKGATAQNRPSNLRPWSAASILSRGTSSRTTMA